MRRNGPAISSVGQRRTPQAGRSCGFRDAVKSADAVHMQGARCAGMVTPCQASRNATRRRRGRSCGFRDAVKSADAVHMQGARCAGMVTPCQASRNAADGPQLRISRLAEPAIDDCSCGWAVGDPLHQDASIAKCRD